MNLFAKLTQRAEAGKPIRIGMIGAGKFGSMFLAQLLKLPGIHLVGVVDLSPANARSNLAFVGWAPERFAAASLDEAARTGRTFVGDNAAALVAHPAIEISSNAPAFPLRRSSIASWLSARGSTSST